MQLLLKEHWQKLDVYLNKKIIFGYQHENKM